MEYILPSHTKLQEEDISFFNLNLNNDISPTVKNKIALYNKYVDEQYKEDWENIRSITNPFEYVTNDIPSYNLSISTNRYTIDHNIFIEINKKYNLFNQLSDLNKTLHFDSVGFNNLTIFKKNKKINKQDNFYIYRTTFNLILIDNDLVDEYISDETVNNILMNLILQQINGNMVLKVGETFSSLMVELIYMLSCFYENIYIYKPNILHTTSINKYIICKKFKGIDDKLSTKICNFLKNPTKLKSILSINLPMYFKQKLEESNAIFGQFQIESMSVVINIICQPNNEKLEKLKNTNIGKCVEWCIKHNQQYNNFKIHDNLFMK